MPHASRRLLLAALAAPVLGRTVAAQPVRPVTVASKLDTEGALLGSMIAQALERRGIPVRARLQLGPTPIVRAALLAGEIDLYPEYTGNGAFFFQLEADPAWRAAASAYDRVRALDAERNDVAWLRPAPANNTWAIAVRQDLAGLNTLEDLGRHLAANRPFKLAASAEFVESPAALPTFQRTYGFTLTPAQLLVLSGGDTAVTMRAAAERLSGVNAAMVYGTDGAIAALGLRVLEDTRGAQIVYEPAPVLRGEVLRRHPGIAEWLAPVFQSLSLTTLQALNARVVVEGRPAATVAADHLRTLGLSG